MIHKQFHLNVEMHIRSDHGGAKTLLSVMVFVAEGKSTIYSMLAKSKASPKEKDLSFKEYSFEEDTSGSGLRASGDVCV